MFTKYENGAEVDIEAVARYDKDAGLEVEAEGVYKYDTEAGAEVEVWSNGIEPLGLYLSSTAKEYCDASITGSTIYLDGLYTASNNVNSRIVIFVESDSPPLITIDSVTIEGVPDIPSGDKIIIAGVNTYYNPKSNTLSSNLVNTNEIVQLASVNICDGSTITDISWQPTLERDNNSYYMILQTYVNASKYDSTHSKTPIWVTIEGLRINGDLVKGNLVGSYES